MRTTLSRGGTLFIFCALFIALIAGCPMMDMDPDPRPKPSGGGDSTPPAQTVSPPAQMAAPSLEAGNKQLTVNWTPPTDTGGSDITAYELRHSDDGGSSWSDIIEIPAPATETIITNLTNGTPYVAQVRARNSAGAGDWSESSDGAMPITVPTEPNNFTLAADDTQITATWAAPTNTAAAPLPAMNGNIAKLEHARGKIPFL